MRLRQHQPKARKACSGRALRWGMKGVGLHDGTSAWARTLGKAGILAAGPWRLLLHPHGDHQHPEVTWCPPHPASEHCVCIRLSSPRTPRFSACSVPPHAYARPHTPLTSRPIQEDAGKTIPCPVHESGPCTQFLAAIYLS